MTKTILIAGTNKESCKNMVRILEDSYRVVEVTSKKSVFEFLNKNDNKISAVIFVPEFFSDRKYDVLHKICIDSKVDRIPVVIITDDNLKSENIALFSHNFIEFIPKSFEDEKIKARLADIIKKYENPKLYELNKFEFFKNSSQMQKMIDSIGSGITATTIDPNNVDVLFINKRFCEIHGYTREQYDSEVENLYSLVDPEYKQYVKDAVIRTKETHQSETLEYKIIRRDGKTALVRAVISAHVMHGQYAVLFGVYTDITEERAIQEKIDNDRNVLQTMMNDTPGGFVRICFKDENDISLEYLNDNYCFMRGLSKEEILKNDSENVMNSVHPDDVDMIREAIRKILIDNKPNNLKYRLKCSGENQYKNISVFARMTTSADGKKHLNLYYADLTEQEKKEQTIREMIPYILSTFLKSSTDIAFTKDNDFKYVCCSPKFLEAAGYKDEKDIIGKTDYELFDKEVADLFRKDDERLLEKDEPVLNYIETIPSKNNVFRYYVMSKYIIRDSTGAMLGTYGTGREITEEKETLERLKLLVNTIPGGIATYIGVYPDLKLNYFNDGYCSMFGYTREEYEKISATGVTNITFAEDVPLIMDRLKDMIEKDIPIDCTYRVHTKSGGYKWVNLRGMVAERNNDNCIFNAVLFDVTESIENERKLRMSEERFRIAAQIGGRDVAHYDINSGIFYHSSPVLFDLGYNEKIENMPDTFINSGDISPEYVGSCADFFEKIKNGQKKCEVDYALRLKSGSYMWFRNDAIVVNDENGQPSQAIIVTTNITQQREKEAAFSKFRQSLQARRPESYTYFRWNLNKEMLDYKVEGALLKAGFEPGRMSFNERTKNYAELCVFKEDLKKYLAFVNSDKLLADFKRGNTEKSMEYRECIDSENIEWRRVSIELAEYPGSEDVEAYLTFEDIDEQKREELRAIELAQTDSLTGVLNRSAFIQKMNQAIKDEPDERHALFMLDIDEFKKLNDTLGHAVGDQALMDTANSLRSILRKGDLLGRLGGDEFLVFLHAINFDGAIEKKAKQIGDLTRKEYSSDICTSTSIGISVYPEDGDSFYSLYRCADAALYKVKDTGKDSFEFFQRKHHVAAVDSSEAYGLPSGYEIDNRLKRRMLIVDDNHISRAMMANLFKNKYIIETANDGSTALMNMRHFGANISIVLLDLMMPGIDGFSVLKKLQENVETSSIPIIVVSGANDKDTCLRALNEGAVDFITKPIDTDILKIRVEAAVLKAESEKKRTQSSYMLLQTSEEAKYRTVLESTGTVVIEYDWVGNVFVYDPKMSKYIAGRYDNRRLWQILLSDMVASTSDVKQMQELTHSIASTRRKNSGHLKIKLKTPFNTKQWFSMNVYKHSDSFQLTSKLFITFTNINEEVIAEEKLHFQAERDELTHLYNRKTFFEKATEMIGEREPSYYTIASFDINGFKVINDQYGNEKGDEFLKHIADVFDTGFSGAGGIVSRITADDFAVLYPTDFMNSNNMFKIYEEATVLDESMPHVSFSIGRYIIDDVSISIDRMLDRAVLARMSIKGRFDMHIALYNESMRMKLLKQQEIVDEMKNALKNKEFEIWFQPQYDYVTKKMYRCRGSCPMASPEIRHCFAGRVYTGV